MNSLHFQYNLGETLWCLENNTVTSGYVETVSINFNQKLGTRVTYLLNTPSNPYLLKEESKLFLTKEALIESL